MRIAILGYSGSGKSTLAKRLSTHYGIPVLYLDTVKFVANWQERDPEEALALVADFMNKPDWVIDGNYSHFRQQERLEQADCIVFLLFSRWNCLYRALKRYQIYKNTTRESMTQGCNEKIDAEFIWWILHQGRTKQTRRHYAGLLEQFGEKSIVIKNQRQLDRFLETVKEGETAPPLA